MALTRITKGVIKPNENYDTHDINSTGIITATGANITGNMTVGGVLTYEDVTNIDSVGLITARNGIDCNGDLDVDGHTNLDHVSIAGITTFTNGFIDFKPGNGGNAHFRILSTGSGEAGIFFDAANGDIAGSDYVFIGQKNNLDFVINPNANAGNIDFQRAGTTQLRIDTSGHVVPGTDSTYDLGLTGTRWRNVYADTLYGDGSNLTGISGVTINNNADNRIITGSGTAATLNGESKLTFDGTNLRIDQGNSADGIVGEAYSTYFGLKHADQTLNSEYMILSKDDHTFISASSGSNVYIRAGGNSSDYQLIVGAGNDALTWRGFKVWHENNDGAGSGLDADTLDGISSGQFLRSDASDTATGQISLTNSSIYPLDINGSNDGKMVLRGSSNPYIRFREGNTDKAHIQWNSTGYLDITNEETDEKLRIQSGSNGLKYIVNGTAYKVWHELNDGSGSGLDADTIDGFGSGQFLRSDTTDSASGAITFTNSGLQLSGHYYQGYHSAAQNYIHFYPANPSSNAGSSAVTTDIRAWNGSSFDTLRIQGGNNTITWRNNTIWHSSNDGTGSGLDADLLDGVQGSSYVREILTDHDITGRLDSGFYETNSATTAEGWPETTNSDFHLIAATHSNTANYYSMQLAGSMHHQNKFYIRSTVNSGTQAWSKIWTSSSDGSGSGLDADTVDSIQASSFLRSDADDTSSGTVAFGVGALDPDSFASFSGGFGGISDGGGWGARGVFVHGGGTGDAAAMAHNGSKLYFGIQDGSSTNSMATWLDVTPNTRVINFQTANNTTNLQCGGNKIFHAGNDGSGSGLDADLLDGAQGGSYLRSDADDVASKRIQFTNNATDNEDNFATATGHLGAFEVYNGGVGNDAFMAFHTGSDYAFYLGLDADTNKLAVGGWSMGAVKYPIYHEGNKPTASDLGFVSSTSNSDVSGRVVFSKNEAANYDDIATGSGSQGCIEIYNQGSGNDAFMAFHTGSDYALYFGLDADTNRLAVGGWSMGAIKPSILHERYTVTRGSSAGDSYGIRISMDGNPAPASVGHNSNHPEGIFWHSNTTNYGIYRTQGNWSGNYQQLRIDWLTGIILDGGSAYGLSGVRFDCHAMPTTNNTYDLGTSSLRFRNVYTNDLNLSNEGGKNNVDGTWGNYTIQEGESDLFLINNRNGKKYKFNLTEV